MAAVKNSEIPKVFKMWGDLFTFQKKYYNAPTDRNSEEFAKFWAELKAEADELEKNYNEDDLCTDIVNAIFKNIGERGIANE